MSLEISTHTLLWEKCAPLLGARVLWFEASSCVLGFILVVKVFLLKNIEKDFGGLSSLVNKGFPGFSYAWCFFL
jgi:hypothetical protein